MSKILMNHNVSVVVVMCEFILSDLEVIGNFTYVVVVIAKSWYYKDKN